MENKNYKLNLTKKQIVITRSLYNLVCKDPESSAAEEILGLMDKFPGFTIVPRTCSAPANPKKTFNGLTVGLIKRYIKAVDPESDNYAKVCDMERRLSSSNLKEDETRATFPQIRAWFFKEYPETVDMGTAGISYETLITEVETKVEAEKKIIPNPAAEKQTQNSETELMAVNQ